MCGYVRTVTHAYASEWTSDKSGHWHACTICGGKDNVVAHVPGAEATEETPQLCTVCNFEINPIKAHEHKFDGDYISDSDGHWKDCRCGESSAKEAHTYDDGKVVKEPTKDEAGEKHYTCTTCGYVKKVELELVAKEVTVTVIVEVEKTPETTPVDKDDKADEGGCKSFASSFAALIMLVTLAGTAVVCKKDKKVN